MSLGKQAKPLSKGQTEAVLGYLAKTRYPVRMSWSRLSEQNLRVDKWSVCRG